MNKEFDTQVISMINLSLPGHMNQSFSINNTGVPGVFNQSQSP